MKIELVSTDTASSHVLGHVPALVGTTAQADVELDSPSPAAYHCLISQVNDQLVVWDLGAGQGTFVNGSRVTKATIKPGDRLRLGGTDFAVRYEHGPRRYMFGVRS